jgi:S1-C subfamily serine protease
MYKLICLTLGLIFVQLATAQVTSNVLLRILLIKTDAGTGTAFTLDIDGRQYVVTAKHMVKGLTGQQTIFLREKGEWSPLPVTIFPCAGAADIAVLIPPGVLTKSDPLEPAAARNVFVTQEVFFIGFPYGQSAQDNSPLFMSRPVPFAKHGILSTTLTDVILVDALNNPGFSGSPIVFRDLNASGPTPVFYVLGVVSSFFPDLVHVVQPEPVKANEDLSKVEGWRIQDGG